MNNDLFHVKHSHAGVSVALVAPFRHRVETAVIQRVTAKQPPGSHRHASKCAVLVDGLVGVVRACRLEAARGWDAGRQTLLIEPDGRKGDSLHAYSCPFDGPARGGAASARLMSAASACLSFR